METWLRNDPIELQLGASESEFEQFMLKELFPAFDKAFRVLTRKTIASLEELHLLKEQEVSGRYLWVTRWGGPLAAVKDPSFRGVHMEPDEAPFEMLQKLETLAQRLLPCIYAEIIAGP